MTNTAEEDDVMISTTSRDNDDVTVTQSSDVTAAMTYANPPSFSRCMMDADGLTEDDVDCTGNRTWMGKGKKLVHICVYTLVRTVFTLLSRPFL